MPYLQLPLTAAALSCTMLLLTRPAAPQIASVPPPSGDHCLSFESAICGTVGWSNTSLPNFLLLTDVVAIERDLQQYLPLYATGCSNALLHVLCAVYYPPCFSTQDGSTHKVLPCFELCEYVRCSCDTAVEGLGAVWPQEFNCSNFPTSRQGELCYPGDVTIQFYREELTLPIIEGQSHLEPKRCGDTPTATTVLPTEDDAQGESPSNCPVAAFSVPNTTGYSGHSFAGVPGCGLPCNPSLLVSGHDSTAVASLTTLGSALGLLTLMFTLATVGIDLERFPYPQRPFVFMALSYCTTAVIHLTTGMRLLASGAPACDTSSPAAVFTMQGLPLTLGQSPTVQQSLCVVTATFLYYGTMAALVWWVVLTFTWFLATALKWAEEAIQKFWLLYHVLGWGVPLLLLIPVLALQEVGGELATGTCYVGTSSVLALGVFVLTPTLLCLALALVFFAVSLLALLRIHHEVQGEGDLGSKVRFLVVRVSVLMACVAVPNLILILLHTYEVVQRPLWEQEAICHATPTEQDPSPLCSLPHKPAPFGYYIVKNLAWMFQVVAMVTWVLSKKTLESWRVFGCSVCGCLWPCGKPAAVDKTTDSPAIQP